MHEGLRRQSSLQISRLPTDTTAGSLLIRPMAKPDRCTLNAHRFGRVLPVKNLEIPLLNAFIWM